MLSIVTKHFEGRALAKFVPGQIVDSTDWPKETLLHAQRYLRPAPTKSKAPTEQKRLATDDTPKRKRRTARKPATKTTRKYTRRKKKVATKRTTIH